MSAQRSPQPTDTGTEVQLAAALERIGNVARLLLRRAAAEHGLSVIQAELVLRLARLAGSGGELRDLTAEFDVSAPTVSDSLAALRRKGLVEVSAPSSDRRRVRNQLTPSGRSVAGVLADWDAPLRRQLSGIAHQGEVLESLLGVIAGLVDEGVITVARTCLTCRFLGTDEPGTDELGSDGQGTEELDADEQGSASRYRCGLLGVPLPPELLRADCPEHQPAVAGRSR